MQQRADANPFNVVAAELHRGGRRTGKSADAPAMTGSTPIACIERVREGANKFSVLQKPGRLTREEFALVKQHPVIGRRILEGVQGFAPFLAAVELHHENWNGTGYPKGEWGDMFLYPRRLRERASST